MVDEKSEFISCHTDRLVPTFPSTINMAFVSFLYFKGYFLECCGVCIPFATMNIMVTVAAEDVILWMTYHEPVYALAHPRLYLYHVVIPYESRRQMLSQ